MTLKYIFTPELNYKLREEIFPLFLELEDKKEGKKEEKFETARRMLLNNFSVEQVITATGLTEEEVKSLMN